MTDIEKLELARHHDKIVKDIQQLLDKYCRIMEWDVPEVDERKARALILAAVRDALTEIDKLA